MSSFDELNLSFFPFVLFLKPTGLNVITWFNQKKIT